MLLSQQSHWESLPGLSDACGTVLGGCQPTDRAHQLRLWIRCCCLHPSSLFSITPLSSILWHCWLGHL